mgnify:CR=1 FL=1
MRYIFSVTPGRSGQASLASLISRCAIGVKAAFEEPQVNPVLPSFLGDFERRLRRRFLETDELLGRGKVIEAFRNSDQEKLNKFGRDRLAWIQKNIGTNDIYFDIGKLFIRGLHEPLAKLIPDAELIFLVRDPILNMRSYVNRNKSFELDNNSPADAVNCLVMDNDLTLPEKYLWAWAEGYLRGLRLSEQHGLALPYVIKTNDLACRETMGKHFSTLKIPYKKIEVRDPINTNIEAGHQETRLTKTDLDIFEAWCEKVPNNIWSKLFFMDNYNPREQYFE